MKLLLVNPNTTASMTEKAAIAARSVASPGTEILASNPSDGPVSIEDTVALASTDNEGNECRT